MDRGFVAKQPCKPMTVPSLCCLIADGRRMLVA